MRCSGRRVEVLETNFPLSTTARYRKTERGGPVGEKPISPLQGVVEASHRPAVRSVLP
jgi:hypothetical protein